MSRMKLAYVGGICGMLLLGTAWGAGATGKPPAVSPGARAAGGAAAGQVKPPDLSENLLPPELVMRAGQQIGLDPAVLQQVRSIMQEARTKLEEAQQKLRTDTLALSDLLKQEPPDAQACLAQLDKVLDDERLVKRLNMEAALKIRGLLTPQQVAALKEFRDKQAGGGGVGGPPEGLRTKMQEVQALAQQRQQEGKDLSGVRQLMQEAKTAAQAGDFKKAEEALDAALQQLN